jgi:hypothetical protein
VKLGKEQEKREGDYENEPTSKSESERVILEANTRGKKNKVRGTEKKRE